MIAFENGKLGDLLLKNRIVHSPTYEGLAGPDGSVTEELIRFNERIAGGGVAMHIVSNSYVHPSGRHLARQVGIDSDELIDGLSRLAAAIRRGGAVSCIQISHCGVHGNEKISGVPSMGPSDMENRRGGRARAMTREEIAEAAGWFGKAAGRARRAGFDAVQIHAGHGYLVSAFLSPYYNKRQDEYGGDTEGRARFLMDVMRAIREEAGASFPVLVKLNSEDGVEGGFTHEMMTETALKLETAGAAAVELTRGCNADAGPFRVSSLPLDPKVPEEEGYYKTAAAKYKERVRTPLILVGGFRSPEGIERVLESGLADFISISRPLVREPELVKRWTEGDRTRAKCISCNRCMEVLGTERGIYCPLEKEN